MEYEHLTKLLVGIDGYRLVLQWVETEDCFHAILERGEDNGHWYEVTMAPGLTIEYAIDALNELVLADEMV